MKRPRQRGTTLIELVVAIVIIGMAATTIVGLLAHMAKSSAENMDHAQCANIANAYLTEILATAFPNPHTITAGRANFDDVDDYAGLNDNGARDRFGNAVAGLAQYQVQVQITSPGFGAIAAAQTRQVQVTVTSPLGTIVQLSGMKTRHP